MPVTSGGLRLDPAGISHGMSAQVVALAQIFQHVALRRRVPVFVKNLPLII